MKVSTRTLGPMAIAMALGTGFAIGQQAPPAPTPFTVGNAVGLPVVAGAPGTFKPMSNNVKMYGGIVGAESCSYDPGRGVIVAPNRSVAQDVQVNNAFISFINHDGSVNTSRWVGVQAPAARANMQPPLVFNEPSGSDIMNDVFYVSDRDGGTGPTDPISAVVRWFSLKDGKPMGEVKVPKSAGFNDIEVMADGTIYATNSGVATDPTTWQVWKITKDLQASIWIQGPPLKQPNGIAFDKENIVVINTGDDLVNTYSPDGKLLKTEKTVQPGNDGLVVMPDGTKYVSSIQNGGVSRIRPGQPADLIAQNIPGPASMCYDEGANQLVVPTNANNGLAFIPLAGIK